MATVAGACRRCAPFDERCEKVAVVAIFIKPALICACNDDPALVNQIHGFPGRDGYEVEQLAKGQALGINFSANYADHPVLRIPQGHKQIEPTGASGLPR